MRTLKSLLLASAIILPLSAAAFAADMVVEQPPEPVSTMNSSVAAPQDRWAGGYVGASLNYDWSKFGTKGDPTIDPKNLSTSDVLHNDLTFKGDGIGGGAFAGYNFQEGNLVYGLEGDVGYSWAKIKSLDVKVTYNGKSGSLSIPDGGTFGVEGGFEGSLRARLGLSTGPVLFYVTGGGAARSVKFLASQLNTINLGISKGQNVTDYKDASKFLLGWTAGAGVEALLTQNIIGRAEYRYSGFGSQKFDLGNNKSVSADLGNHEVRVGIGYKF